MTTSPKNTPQLPARIQQLLELYYDGRTDAAQEAELTQYFTQTPDIPADNLADAAIFRAMAAYEAPEVPDDLEQRIIDATCGKATYNAHMRHRLIPWLSAAAAAVIIAVLAFTVTTHRSAPGTLLAPQADAPATAAVTPAPRPEPTPAPEPEPAPIPAPAHKTVHKTVHKTPPVPAPVEIAQADPYTEITDLDSAVTITREVLDRLGITLAMAGDAIGRTDMAMNTVDQTIKTITQ